MALGSSSAIGCCCGCQPFDHQGQEAGGARLAQARARRWLRKGVLRIGDLLALQLHHGNMPPKTPPQKAQGKAAGKSRESTIPTTSVVQMGFPSQVVAAIHAIPTRAIAGLRLEEFGTEADHTVIQANHQASAASKVTRRPLRGAACALHSLP